MDSFAGILDPNLQRDRSGLLSVGRFMGACDAVANTLIGPYPQDEINLLREGLAWRCWTLSGAGAHLVIC